MRIQHNIMAMNAYRNYSNNTSALSKNLEKLSSGYRINRAGDDAAGLAISEKMRAQITGLSAAQKNVKDGISLVKTAEGATQEIHDMLNRMVYLAEQSANGTYQDEVDREAIESEFNSLKTEINRIADSSNFNGINLLDGSMSATGSPSVKGKYNLPAAGTVLGVDTVLNNTHGPAKTSGTEFSIDLHNVGFSNNVGESLVINVGDTKIALAGDGQGYMDGDAILDAIVAGGANVKINGDAVADPGKLKINDQEFGIAKDTAGGSARLKFTQTAPPATKDEEVSGAMKVSIEGAIVDGTEKASPIYEASNAGTAGTAIALTVTGVNLADANDAAKLTAADITAITGTTGKVGNTDIDLAGLELTTDNTIADAKAAILKAAQEAAAKENATNKAANTELNDTYNEITIGAGTGGNASFSIANTTTTQTVTGVENTGAELVDYNVSTTDIKNVTADDNERLASTYFDLTKDVASDGGQVTIGKDTYTFTTDATFNNGSTTDKHVYIGDLDSKASDYLTKVAERLSDEAEKNSTFTVGHDGSRITVTEIKGQTDFVKADGATSSLDTMDGLAKALGYKTSGVKGTGLTLQIGDTSDKFNQLTVSIKDMHVQALGLADVTLSNQTGAQDAVKSIKDAINYVSTVRSDLGATQNRLEHTSNNLSVMKENIQDAESSIRDTDIAEEMMAYTKNNILVQSAQAMLAQANQIPQGVLQLLG